ncbi:MAG: hypothetical protein WAM70_11715 [Pyrinomonadaceae bacterium]
MANAKGFPKAGKFQITSAPIFLLIKGNQSELLVMKAKMKIDTGNAYTNGSKKRQVDVQVGEWVATGKSKMLGGKVEFRLSKDAAQPKSFVTAGKSSAKDDFPAKLRFGMRYDVETPQGTLTGLSGVAIGSISAFPPKAGDVFNLRKTLEVRGVRVIPVACACASEELLVSFI